ncbi:hypothetical protein D3C86_1541220 [compost metagenome]
MAAAEETFGLLLFRVGESGDFVALVNPIGWRCRMFARFQRGDKAVRVRDRRQHGYGAMTGEAGDLAFFMEVGQQLAQLLVLQQILHRDMAARHEYGIELVVADFLNLREADCRRAALRGQLQRVQQRETFLTGLFIAAPEAHIIGFLIRGWRLAARGGKYDGLTRRDEGLHRLH